MHRFLNSQVLLLRLCENFRGRPSGWHTALGRLGMEHRPHCTLGPGRKACTLIAWVRGQHSLRAVTHAPPAHTAPQENHRHLPAGFYRGKGKLLHFVKCWTVLPCLTSTRRRQAEDSPRGSLWKTRLSSSVFSFFTRNSCWFFEFYRNLTE